jgi:hypothetical protein
MFFGVLYLFLNELVKAFNVTEQMTGGTSKAL